MLIINKIVGDAFHHAKISQESLQGAREEFTNRRYTNVGLVTCSHPLRDVGFLFQRIPDGFSTGFHSAVPQPIPHLRPIQFGFTLTGEAQMFVSRPVAYGFAVKNSVIQHINKLFAFIPLLKHVGFPAHRAKPESSGTDG